MGVAIRYFNARNNYMHFLEPLSQASSDWDDAFGMGKERSYRARVPCIVRDS